MPFQNAEIAAMFDQTADLLEIKGDNPFRTRAYHRAARVIERLPKSIASLVQAGEDLSELPGIGKDLAGKGGAIVSSGRFDLLESLKRQLPGDLGEIAALPGLGPKRVKLLYDKLGIRSIADLRWALKAHRLRELRGIANEHGWKLNEYVLFDGRRRIAGATEEELYGRLGLAFVPPELREDRGEIALAQKKSLPKLLSLSDIRGDLHVHSNWSDGTAPVANMAAAARERGYAYMAITDHSQRVNVARGLDAARLSRQIDEIDRLNDKLDGFAVLKGIEVDILADGRLDLADRTLSRLDIVVASIHYKFDLSRHVQTERIIRAMDNRHMSILGHLTVRLIGAREPYDLDMERIIATARERGCHLELNADPERLDLTDIHVQAAKSAGVKVAISTDAHSTAGFGHMRFGVDQARRGWLGPSDVINTRPLSELRKLLKR